MNSGRITYGHSHIPAPASTKNSPKPFSRPRSLPHRIVFVSTVLVSSLHYMGIIAMITTLVMFYLQPTPAATAVFLCSLFFSVITWIIAFFKRRTAHCALCKGTPLIDSGALAHQKAKRLFPFSYGVTATLSIIATQKFRCMYCGTEFDLLKPSTLSSQNHSHGSLKYQDSYTSYTSYTEYKSDEDAD